MLNYFFTMRFNLYIKQYFIQNYLMKNIDAIYSNILTFYKVRNRAYNLVYNS